MIVRNAEATIRRAIAPFLGVADEIVAADTGSTDSTATILAEMGVRVVAFPWRDDFAAARNAALDACETEWIFSLDADEWVTRQEAEEIGRLAREGASDAYLFETRNFVSRQDATTVPTSGEDRAVAPYYSPSTKVRLARRAGIRWEGAVHELLDFSARRAGFRIARADIPIRHDGSLGAKKNDAYARIAEEAYRRGEAHAAILFVLGLDAMNRGDLARAEGLFREAEEKEHGYPPPAAWRAWILQRTGRSDEAVALLLAALKETVADPLILEVLIETYTAREETAQVRTMRALACRLHPRDPRFGLP